MADDLYAPIGGSAEEAARRIAARNRERQAAQAAERKQNELLAAGAVQETKRTTAARARGERQKFASRQVQQGLEGEIRLTERLTKAQSLLARTERDIARQRGTAPGLTPRAARGADPAVLQQRLNARQAEVRAIEKQIAAERGLAQQQAKAPLARHVIPPPTRPVPGSGLVPRTPAYGAVGGPMFGQYPYAPLSRQQTVVRQPVEERGVAQPPRRVADTRALSQNQARMVLEAAQAHANYAKQADLAAASDAQLARQRAGMTNATRQAALAAQQSSQVMRKHGALTSEFIAAAARGETTFAEMRYQMVATIGKFAGWTAAAGFIYGALDAIHALGRGAIEAQSGVAQLSRVVTDVDKSTASSGIRDLAREFNVPIDVAADAAYRMGQIFHNQADALEAARAALYSYKTGEVDVASSTSALTAIVTGFGYSSAQLVDVYDQINQAQNLFGVGIGDTEAGLAKAGGTWVNAGGQLEYLLGLFVAIQRSTRRTGQEIGTGLSRSQNFLRQPRNQALLEAEGVKVDPQDIEATFQSAMRAAQRPGADLRNIAVGLLGPQYARLLESTLRDQTVLNAALRDTSPEKAKGSAQKELAKVLTEAGERIKQVGVNLELIGAALYEAGFFDVFGIALITLNEMLHVIESIVNIVGDIPAPFRQMVVYGGQMLAIMAAMRRFGVVGGDGPGRIASSLSFLDQPEQRAKRQIVSGLRGQVEYAQNTRERYGQEAFGHAMRQEAEVLAADEVRAQQIGKYAGEAQAESFRKAIRNAPDLGAAEDIRRTHADRAFTGIAPQLRAGLDEEYQRVSGRALAAEEDRTASMQKANAATDVVARTERELAEAQQVRAKGIYAFAREKGYYAPSTMMTPTTMPLLTPDALPGADREGRITRGPGKWEQAAKLRVADTAIRLQDMGKASKSIALAEAAALRGVGVTAKVGRAAGGLAQLPGRIMTEARGIAQSLGTLDRIMFAAMAAFIAYEGLQKLLEKGNADLDRAIAAGAQTPVAAADFQKRIDEAQAQQGGDTFTDYLQEGVQTALWLPITAMGGDFREGPGDRRRRAAAQSEQEIKFIEQLQQRNRERGVPVANQKMSDIFASQNQFIKDYRDGIISQSQFIKAMEQGLVEVKTAQDTQKGDLDRYKARSSAQLPSGRTYRTAIQGLDEESLNKRMEALGVMLQGPQGDDAALAKLRDTYLEVARQRGASQKDDDIIAVAKARDDFYDSLEDYVSGELEDALSLAPNEGARHSAFRSAARVYRRQQLQPARRRVSRLNRRISGAQADLQDLMQTANVDAKVDSGIFGEGIGLQGVSEAGGRDDLKKSIEDASKRLHKLKTRKRAAQREIAESEDRLRLLERELSRQEYEDRAEGRELASAAVTSETYDTYDDIQESVRLAGLKLREAIQRFGARSREALQAIADQNAANHEAGRALGERMQATGQLNVAQARGDTAEARTGLAEARRYLAHVLANPDDYSFAEIQQARTAVAQANDTLAGVMLQNQASIYDLRAARARDPVKVARIMLAKAKYELQHADDRTAAMIEVVKAERDLEEALADRAQARFELLQAKTEDPVKDADLALRAALRAVRGKKGAPRLQALAEVRNAQLAKRDAKVQQAVDRLEFRGEMTDMTNQALINGYESILENFKGTKNMSTQMRKDLRLKIKQLKDEMNQEAGGFDMDVGNIQLPTVYEIRRAVGAGTAQDQPRQQTTVIHHNNRVGDIYIGDDADADAFFDRFDMTMGTSVSGSAKSAGVI